MDGAYPNAWLSWPVEGAVGGKYSSKLYWRAAAVLPLPSAQHTPPVSSAVKKKTKVDTPEVADVELCTRVSK